MAGSEFTMALRPFTAADWDAIPPWMFGDQDRPVERCSCRHCESQGYYEQGRDCVHWQECDMEAGRHGEECRCEFPAED